MTYTESRKAAIIQFEVDWLRTALEASEWNVSRCARDNGIDRVYLHRLIRRHKAAIEAERWPMPSTRRAW